MGRGPAGVKRPLVTTNLKYDVSVIMPEEIEKEPPKARDVLDMRVNAVQNDVIEEVRDSIGRVIMAVNRLAHPSGFKIVNTERKLPKTGGTVPRGHIQLTWTYIMRGSGMGEFANVSTTSSSVWKLHEVLIRGNIEPIEKAQAQRDFDSGPLEVERVVLSTK